ncbi:MULTISPECIES: hypothetical protein [unclassified Rhizobium]|uniref:hypothetical protein n=1 Tax=unclassified Rhizobium TaxID=2613769 RepID=UPI001ADC536D|nr:MULTISPECIES: hypothetical protein [unclassified Rhizobium]MBO9124639.1 hypothetical protein [Rhizobium sp. 16-488-2b]MBO9175223.1 hypothetical protein [Rhizobium sp. 16-488-2a]
MTSQAFCDTAASQPVSGQTRAFPSMPLEALLDADPDASLWERLYWQFTLPTFLSTALNGLGEDCGGQT